MKGDALDLLSSAKLAATFAIMDFVRADDETRSMRWPELDLVDLLEAYALARGAWHYILRSGNTACITCGSPLAYRPTCPGCAPPDGEV